MSQLINHCYVCGDGDGEPSLCCECDEFALMNRNSAMYKYKNSIDNYTSHLSTINYCFNILKDYFINGYQKCDIDHIKGIKKDAVYHRMKLKQSIKEIISDDVYLMASAEMSVYRLFKEISEHHVFTKKEILEVIKIPSVRFTVFNRLYKRKAPYFYGKRDIEIMMANLL